MSQNESTTFLVTDAKNLTLIDATRENSPWCPNAMPLKLFLQYSSSKLASCPIIQIHGIACHHDVTTKTLMLSWTVWWKKCQDCHPWHQAIGYKSFLKMITGNLLKNTLNTVGSDITLLKDAPILEPFQIQRTKQVRIPFRVVWTHCNYQ